MSTAEQMESYQSLHVEIDRLRSVNNDLLTALEDIAEGKVSKYDPHFLDRIETEAPGDFRSRMWEWSQKLAREAIAKVAR
jgi:hypothetical protein